MVYPTSLWIGDSYTAGNGAGTASDGEACRTAVALRWQCVTDAEGGTGFIANGHVNSAQYAPLAQRLHKTVRQYPKVDVIVVDAGRNDVHYPARQVKAAVSKYFDSLGHAYPGVPVVVVAPWFMNPAHDRSAVAVLGDLLRAQAKARDWKFVNPNDAGWLGPATAALTVSDHIHPDLAGAEYVAKRLAPEIAAVVPKVKPRAQQQS